MRKSTQHPHSARQQQDLRPLAGQDSLTLDAADNPAFTLCKATTGIQGCDTTEEECTAYTLCSQHHVLRAVAKEACTAYL